MKLSLVVLNAGKMEGQRIPITLPQFIIGRDPECNLRPASAVISKRHCAVISKDGQISVRDFDSTNGTFLNDVPVKGEAPLKHNDVLKVGPLSFRVAMEIKPPGSKPTPPPTKSEADDDSIAAMLLSLQEDGTGDASTQGNESSVPAGSTVMDIMPFGQNPESADKAAEEAKKKAEAKKPPETAHVAAKAILDKYTRRTRR